MLTTFAFAAPILGVCSGLLGRVYTTDLTRSQPKRRNILNVDNGSHDVSEGLVFASGNALITCGEDSTAMVILTAQARCNAGGKSRVTARENSSVNLFGAAHGEIYHRARCSAHGKSFFTAQDEASVVALEGSSGVVIGDAQLLACGRSETLRRGSGPLKMLDQARVLWAPRGRDSARLISTAGLGALADNLERQAHCTSGLVINRSFALLIQELRWGKVSAAQETISHHNLPLGDDPTMAKWLRGFGFKV